MPDDLTYIYDSKSYYVKEKPPVDGEFGYYNYINYGSYLEEHFEEQIIELEKDEKTLLSEIKKSHRKSII